MAQRGFGKPGKKGRSYERILELKSMVDRIINDCSIESKQVREGLKAIKDYQLGVLGEIRDLPEDDDDRTYNGRERETYEPFSRTQEREYDVAPYSDPRTASQLANLREEKINLMNELNGEIRQGNKLAQNYKSLEGDYAELKKEVDRLKRRKHDESSNEGESIIHKMPREEPVRPRTTEEYAARHRGEEAPTRHRIEESYKPRYVPESRYEEPPPRKYQEPPSRGRPAQSLKSENARLKEELAQAYKKIDKLTALCQELERKLRLSEQEVARLEKELSRRARGGARADGAGDLMAQLEQLKRHNEELRVETIRLLKLKGSHGGDAAYLQEEIERLHDLIERENQHKRQFVQDVEKYKRKFASIEQENKSLKARIEELTGSRAVDGARYTTSYAAADYQPRPTAGVFGDDKLDKYKSVLHGLKNSSGTYGYT